MLVCNRRGTLGRVHRGRNPFGLPGIWFAFCHRRFRPGYNGPCDQEMIDGVRGGIWSVCGKFGC